ncbi:MAG TPA: carbohydrate-binding protein, partial [Tepidisphaeraceae bacterium]|nr:carbohydrate-binding protein [Tepidisphaeraceae bacterium]
ATGVHDVFMTCTDGGFNFQGFKFLRPLAATDPIPATCYSAFKGIQESRPGIVGHTDDGDWIKYDQVNFGNGVSFVAVDLAMGPKDAKVEFHLDSPDGPLIGALIPISTGSWTNFQLQETPIKDAAGVHDLYLTFHGGKGLPDVRSIQFKADGK